MVSLHVAVLLMLVSASLMSLSSIVFKIAGTKTPPMEGQSIGKNIALLARNRLWLLGLSLSISALALNTVAVATADMSLIQPLSGFGLVVLVIAARFLLGEKISAREAFGIFVAIAGVAVVGSASNEGSSDPSVIELSLYLQPLALLWIGILVGFIAVSWLLCRAWNYRGASLIFAANTSFATVLGITFSRGFFSQLGAEGGIGPIQFLFLFLFLFFVTFALFLQQFALQKGRAVLVVPIMNMIQVAAPIPTGFLVFHESVGLGRLAGLAILAAGVLLLSLRVEAGKPSIDSATTDG